MAHAPGGQDVLESPYVLHILLGGVECVYVAVRVLQVQQQIHEEIVYHKGLVELSDDVQIDACILQDRSINQVMLARIHVHISMTSKVV